MTTLRQLSYLVAIADIGHFGRAAAASNISQPTLSHQLRALEESLGVTVVERGSNPVQMTPIGRELAERARKILVDMAELERLAAKAKDDFAGTIRFGVTPTLGPYLLPPVVGRLHREHPDLRFYIRDGIPDEQLAQLRRGALDLLLVPLPVAGDDLHVEPLFREPLHIVAPPDHPLSAREEIELTDLAGCGFLTLDRRHPLHRMVAELCDEIGATLLRDYEGTSLDSLRQMAGSGLGLAVLPEFYLRSEADLEGMVKRLSPKGWAKTRSLAAVWRRGAAYADSYRVIAEAIAEGAHEILSQPLTPGR